MLWGILSHSSLATVMLDYTNTLSFLGDGEEENAALLEEHTRSANPSR